MPITVSESILSIAPYVPGKPIEELEREYGIKNAVKLASNENPLGASPGAVAAIEKSLGSLHRYPDSSAHALVRKLSAHLGVPPEAIVLGNGSDEIIVLLERLFLRPGDEVILPRPSFLMYDISVLSAGATPVSVPLKDLTVDLTEILRRVTPKTRMIFLCNPNNPTGTIVTKAAFDAFLAELPPDVIVVVDEAYIEFARDPECLRSVGYATTERPVVTLRTFSKAYGLAGLRVGYGVTSPEIAELLQRLRPPFNTSIPAQAGAAAALADREFLEKTLRVVHEGLDFLYSGLNRRSIRYFPTQANFFLIDTGRSADAVFEGMLREGVIVRSMTAYGYPDYIRINAGLPDENRRFLDALDRVLQ